MHRHDVPAHRANRLAPFIGDRRAAELETHLGAVAGCLSGRRVVQVTGNDRRKGGVYEVLRTTLPYLQGAGVDVMWVDLPTRPEDRPALEFFHVLAHGVEPKENWREDFAIRRGELREFGRNAASELASVLRPSDVVVLHDTQTAPLAAYLEPWESRLLWHAHIGTADRNPVADAYWEVLASSVARARARVFYRPEYAPPNLLAGSMFIPPSIDPANTKNAPMSRETACSSLATEDPTSPLSWVESRPQFSPSLVVGLQLSRWDLLKDMPGAVRVFGDVAARCPQFTGLVVGPAAQSRAERLELEAAVAARARLDSCVQSRVHLGVIGDSGTPAHDSAVRLLQSRADIVLQKSTQEGFGLTVTEAMLRGSAVVASQVGGISLQIESGRNGVTVDPNAEDGEWAIELESLVEDDEHRQTLGNQARTDTLEKHAVDRQLTALVQGLTVSFGDLCLK
jgi:trehalose synthase